MTVQARLVVGAIALAMACGAATASAQDAPGQSSTPLSSTQDAGPPLQPTPSATPVDPMAGWTFNSAFEGYYEWNANRPLDRINVLRAYDTRANTFSLQQVALVAEHAPDVAKGRRAGLRVDLQFGQATETLQGNPVNEPRPQAYRQLWQAYGTYVFPIGKKDVQVDFGKFASILGYETNYAKDDSNFSRAYLFNFLPFYHSGVRTTIPVNDKLTFMYMLTNGIQQTEDFNNFKSNHVAAVVKPASSVSWTTSYYFGQEQPDNGLPNGPNGFFRVFDSYVSYTPSSPLSAGLDVTHVTNQVASSSPKGTLTGLGAYLRHQTTARAAMAVRYEWLDDAGGLFGGIAQKLQEVTLTAEQRMEDGFLVRAEFRRDWSDHSFFPARSGGPRTGQNTILVGLVWWMGAKKGGW